MPARRRAPKGWRLANFLFPILVVCHGLGLSNPAAKCEVIFARALRSTARSPGPQEALATYGLFDYIRGMRIGIVGARLAGAYSALLLLTQGHEVFLFDPAPDGEKPCGGGITGKAVRTFPWILETVLPRNDISMLELTTQDGRSAAMGLRQPIHVFSRALLDGALRHCSIRAGARFIPQRVHRVLPRSCGWSIVTSLREQYNVDFLIGADGANSAIRTVVSNRLEGRDLSLALGFYLPGVHHPNRILVCFQEKGFHGYLWSFPRTNHASVGIVHPLAGIRTAEMRHRLAAFIAERYPGHVSCPSRFFAARVPCLRRRTLVNQHVCGRNWALVGDAAGFVDALTSEGISFALRSAQLMAQSLEEGNSTTYEEHWRADFGLDLERAAVWRDTFYDGALLNRSIPSRMVQMIRGSATVRRIADRLICGRHSYPEMRARLLSRSPIILAEAMWSRLFRGAAGWVTSSMPRLHSARKNPLLPG